MTRPSWIDFTIRVDNYEHLPAASIPIEQATVPCSMKDSDGNAANLIIEGEQAIDVVHMLLQVLLVAYSTGKITLPKFNS